MVAIQLIYQTDNLVVGAFVSASAVTFYSIGNSLCRYTQQLVGAMTATFTPAASTYDATGDASSLRALYYNGTRATMAVSLPVLVTLIFRAIISSAYGWASVLANIGNRAGDPGDCAFVFSAKHPCLIDCIWRRKA